MYAFSTNENLDQLISDGLSKLQGFSFPENPSLKVLLIIDVPIPEAFPTHTNPESISAVINLLKSKGFTNIQLIGLAEHPYSDKMIMDSFGLSDYFTEKGINVLSMEDEGAWISLPQELGFSGSEYLVPKALTESDLIISVNQLKFNPYLGIYGVCEMMSKILMGKSGNLEFRFDILFQLLSKKNIIYINDGYYLGIGTTPFVCENSQVLRMNTMIFSLHPLLCDIICMYGLGIKDPLSLMEQRLIPDCKSHIPENLLSLPESQFNNLFPPHIFKDFFPLGLKELFPEGPKVYLGQTSHGSHYLLCKYLSELKSMMIKDITHFNEYTKIGAILIGKSPVEPEEKENVIVFGSDAQTSTLEYQFRKKIKFKKVLDEKALEHRLFEYDMKADLKIDDIKEKYMEKIEQIQQKQEADEKKDLVEKIKKAHEKKLAKIEAWREKKKAKVIAKNEKKKKYNQNPKIKINKKITVIESDLPHYQEYLSAIVSCYGKSIVPTVDYFYSLYAFYLKESEKKKKPKNKEIQSKQEQSKKGKKGTSNLEEEKMIGEKQENYLLTQEGEAK